MAASQGAEEEPFDVAALMESFILSLNGFPNGNSAPNLVTQVNKQQVPSQAAFRRPNGVNEDVVHPQMLNMCRSCPL